MIVLSDMSTAPAAGLKTNPQGERDERHHSGNAIPELRAELKQGYREPLLNSCWSTVYVREIPPEHEVVTEFS